jgi:HAMP domain-containing protein
MLAALSPTLSTDPAERLANDALLRKVEAEVAAGDSHILLFAPDGTNIGSSANPDYPRPNASDRTYFREAMAGHSPAVGDPIRVRSGRWVVNVARPIRDETGRIRAVLTVGPVLDHFQDTLKLRMLPPGSVINIVNAKGIVVAWSADDRDQIGRQVTWGHLQPRLAAREGSDVSRWSGVGTVNRVNGFSTAHRVPWLVTVGVPMNITYGALASRLKWSALIVLGTLLAAFGIAWLLSGRIVRPLQQLGKDAAVLAAGELGHRTAVRTRDEVARSPATSTRWRPRWNADGSSPARQGASCGKRRIRSPPWSIHRRSPSFVWTLTDPSCCGVAAPSRYSVTALMKCWASAASWCRPGKRRKRRRCSHAPMAARPCGACR